MVEPDFSAGVKIAASALTDAADGGGFALPETDALYVIYDREGPCPPGFARLVFHAASLARVDQLWLAGEWGDSTAEAIARSPSLGGLRGLHMPYAALGPGGVTELFGSERLSGLEELDLSGNPAGFADLAFLRTLDRLPPALQVLRLADCGIDDPRLEALTGLAARLRTLELRDNRLTAIGLRRLLQEPALREVVLLVDLDPLPRAERPRAAEELWRRERAAERSTTLATAQD